MIFRRRRTPPIPERPFPTPELLSGIRRLIDCERTTTYTKAEIGELDEIAHSVRTELLRCDPDLTRIDPSILEFTKSIDIGAISRGWREAKLQYAEEALTELERQASSNSDSDA